MGRRITECAARLVNEILVPVPMQQLALTLPYQCRHMLAWDLGLSRGRARDPCALRTRPSTPTALGGARLRILGLPVTESWIRPLSKGKKGLDQLVWEYLELALHSLVCPRLRGGIHAPGSSDNLSTPSGRFPGDGQGHRLSLDVTNEIPHLHTRVAVSRLMLACSADHDLTVSRREVCVLAWELPKARERQ